MATNNANNGLSIQGIVGIVSGHYWQVVAFGTPSFTPLLQLLLSISRVKQQLEHRNSQ